MAIKVASCGVDLPTLLHTLTVHKGGIYPHSKQQDATHTNWHKHIKYGQTHALPPLIFRLATTVCLSEASSSFES